MSTVSAAAGTLDAGLDGHSLVLHDPDDRLRGIVAGLLVDEGAEVLAVTADPSSAVRMVRLRRPDALVMHVEGSRTETLLVIDAVQRWRRDQPIVVFSSLTDPAAQRVFERRGIEVVPPAHGIDGLGAAIHRARRRHVSPLTP